VLIQTLEYQTSSANQKTLVLLLRDKTTP